MELFTYFRSSASYRVRIALALKNVSYRPVYLDLRGNQHQGAEYRSLNPLGLVPALRVGERLLTQSLAIVEYLDSIHPQPPLLPADDGDRASVRAAAQLIACDIHPLNNLRVLKYLKNTLGQEQGAIDAWYRHWIAEGFAALERMVEPGESQSPCCFGSQIGLADVCLAPQMYNARRFDTDLSPYPKLVRIDAYLTSLPAFQAAAPENQPDAD